MKRISFVSALAALVSVGMSPAAEAPPNFVFVIADDLTFRDIGCYGGQAHTPNIDRLASEGMQFERCFQTAPMCSPTRHNIYTGLYPVKSGAYPNHTFAHDDVKSIVHYLKPLGYRVALSGKTHIAPQTVFPFEYTVADKNPDMEAIDQLMAESVEAGTPFCVFACSNEPHTPWNRGDPSRYPLDEIELPPYLVDSPSMREEFSRYLAEITYYDDQVGQLLDLLDKHGLAENTMVMVVSEQGNSLPFAKWTCYDNGLQSAMVVRWPGKVKPGAKSRAMVEYVDVVPTFVDAAGGKPAKVLDGRSFVPVLTGESKQHKQFSYGLMTTRGIINGSEAYPIRSIRSKQYRLILNLNHEATFTNAMTKNALFEEWIEMGKTDPQAQYWVDRYQHRPAVELFDTRKDPLNLTNLAEDPEYAEVIEDLTGRLQTWMKEQGDEGMPTEMAAEDHQKRAQKKNKKAPQKKGKTQPKTERPG